MTDRLGRGELRDAVVGEADRPHLAAGDFKEANRPAFLFRDGEKSAVRRPRPAHKAGALVSYLRVGIKTLDLLAAGIAAGGGSKIGRRVAHL